VTLGTAAAIADLSQAQFMQALTLAGQDTVVVDWDDLDRALAFLAERRSRGLAAGGMSPGPAASTG